MKAVAIYATTHGVANPTLVKLLRAPTLQIARMFAEMWVQQDFPASFKGWKIACIKELNEVQALELEVSK